MINRQMQPCEVWETIIGYDDYGAPKQDLELVANIEMAINHKSFNTFTQDARFTNVTHIGLTNSKSLLIGQKVIDSKGVEYKVDFVNHITRLSQIYLIEVVEHV